MQDNYLNELISLFRPASNVLKRIFNYINNRIHGSGLGGVFLRGISSASLVKICGTGITFVLHLILARFMGVDSYGVYVYVLSWTVLLTTFTRLGLEQCQTKYVPIYLEQAKLGLIKGLIKKSDQLTFFASLVAIVFSLLAVWFMKNSIETECFETFGLFTISLPFLSIIGIRSGVLRALNKVAYSLAAETIIRPLLIISTCSLLFCVFKNQINAQTGAVIYTISSAVTCIIVMSFARKHLPKGTLSSAPIFRTNEWTAVAVSILFYTLLNRASAQVDVLMVGSLLKSSDAGIYTAAKRLNDLSLFGFEAVNIVVAPIISMLYSSGQVVKLEKLIVAATLLTVLVALPVGLTMIFFGDYFLGLYGKEFVGGHSSLIIFSIGTICSGFFGTVPFLLIMTKFEKIAAISVGISLVLSIIGNYFLIPIYGINGAAITKIVLNISWYVLVSIFIYKKIGINPTLFRNYAKTVRLFT